MIFRRSPASSSFVLAAARLRALQLDPGRATRRPGHLRGRIQKNSQPSPAARVVTGPDPYALLTTVALMGAANRVFLDCSGADIRVRRECRTRPVAPHGKADRGSRRRGERGASSGTPRCCRNSRTAPGWPGCRPDAWRPGVIRAGGKDASPGIIQRARLRQAVSPPERRGGARQCVPGRRGAARCGFPAGPRPATPSR